MNTPTPLPAAAAAMTKDEAAAVLAQFIDFSEEAMHDANRDGGMYEAEDDAKEARAALRALTATAGVPDGFAVNKASIDALVAGPFMYHHKMDERQECEAKGFDRCREMTLQSIEVFFAARDAMLAAAPPSDAPGEGCPEVCGRAMDAGTSEAVCPVGKCERASPAEQGAREDAGITCARCKGSGEGTVQVGVGPDAYDAPVMCEACGGSGAFDGTEPLRAFPTMLRKMWSGGDVQRWIDENIAPAYAAVCTMARRAAPLAAGRVGVVEARSVIDRVVTDALTRTDGTGMFRVSYVNPDSVKSDAPRAGLTDGQIADAVAVLRELTGESKIDMPDQRADYLARMARRIFALAGPVVAGEVACGKCGVRQPLRHSPDCGKALVTTGHCENHKKPGGCPLHNIHCGWPKCDERPLVYADTAKGAK